MPVGDGGAEGEPLPGADLPESIVEGLTNHTATIEVIGPTTTSLYRDRPGGVRHMIEELEVDYVVNARVSAGASGSRLLIEIIRATDGAHVWARYFDELPAGLESARIVAAVVQLETLSPD